MNNNTSNVSILATTTRGAKLISNGAKAVWVMGRQVREDGTLTHGALVAIENSTLTHDAAVLMVKARNGEAAAREELRKQAREESNTPVTVTVLPANWCGEHGNAWQVRTANTFRNRYGRVCTYCCFLPKSKVTVVRQADGSVNITMPAWVLRNNSSMVHTMVD